MKPSRLMQERIRRTHVLLRELGHEVQEGEVAEDSYSGGFVAPDGFQAGFFIDSDSKFLELAFTFTFGNTMADFIRERIEEMLHTLYEYGCYLSLQIDQHEITYTIFSKIYFAGLNYFALKETIRDFRDAVDANQEIFEIHLENEKGASHGDS
ncbi:MAG TPA: hypothetical protein VJ932_06560 [Alkalispirochaeta sp.]|nr:hypothetical protein [Alkalispirochaeta sp.]